MAIPTPVVFLGGVAIAAGLLWRQGTLRELGERAGTVAPALLIGILALYLVGLALLCLRWHALVRMAGGAGGVPLAAEAFLTSVVINYAAPIGLAVPTRAALSARDLGLSAGAGAAVALWEVVLDVAVLAAFSLAWLSVGGAGVVAGLDISPVWLGLGAAIVLGGCGLAALVAWRRPAWRRRAGVAVADLLRYPGQRPGATALAVGLSVVYWLLQAVVLRLLLDAVGVGVGAEPALVLGLIGPPILIGMLSPIPGGAGVREALMASVAAARGVDGVAVFFAAVAYRVALFVAIPPLYAAVRIWRAVATRRRRTDVRSDGRSRSRPDGTGTT